MKIENIFLVVIFVALVAVGVPKMYEKSRADLRDNAERKSTQFANPGKYALPKRTEKTEKTPKFAQIHHSDKELPPIAPVPDYEDLNDKTNSDPFQEQLTPEGFMAFEVPNPAAKIIEEIASEPVEVPVWDIAPPAGGFETVQNAQVVGSAVSLPEQVISPEVPELPELNTPQVAPVARRLAPPMKKTCAEMNISPLDMDVFAKRAETASEPSSEPETKKVLIYAQGTEIRDILRDLARQSGLEIYTSIEVQGEASLEVESDDYDLILNNLLAGTAYQYERDGNFVYVGKQGNMGGLPIPLNKRSSQEFRVASIAPDMVELAIRANMSDSGNCTREIDSDGTPVFRVEDYHLALNDLEQILPLIDVPGPEPKLDAFVFQHEMDGNQKPLALVELGDNRGLVVQEVQFSDGVNSEASASEESKKKMAFGVRKSKKSDSDARTFTISHRLDTFLLGLEDQRDTRLASGRETSGSKLVLGRPMTFPFAIDMDGKIENYRLIVTIQENRTPNEGRFLFDVQCQRDNIVGDGKIPDLERFSGAIDMGNGLVLQMPVSEFKREHKEKRKNPVNFMTGNRVGVEAVVVLVPREETAACPESVLPSATVKYLSRQFERLSAEYATSQDSREKLLSQGCAEAAQRLKALVYDVKIR